MTAPIVFLDLETTGLSLDDHIWEIGAVRRDASGEVPLHLFVEHSAEKAAALPDSFKADHDARFDAEHAVSPMAAARLLHRHLAPGAKGEKAHIVGAVPNFDTERVARLFAAHGLEANWHYHLIDVENLAVGWLMAKRPHENGSHRQRPWNSDGLSRAVGIDPPSKERHTAMGDVAWAMALFDRIMSPELSTAADR